MLSDRTNWLRKNHDSLSALEDLNKIDSNISVEDPVEFNLQGVNQWNIRKEAGLDFASA